MKTHLTKLVNTGKQFTLFFVNGYRGKYTLLDFDDETFLVKDENGKHQLILIHAVSTIDLG